MIATEVGGVADVVGDGTGVLVQRNDTAAFTEAIIRLAGASELRRSLGLRARKHVDEHFHADLLIKRVERLYDELVGLSDGRR